jgi:N-acetylglucosamine kinase-like BadF-type ATPase
MNGKQKILTEMIAIAESGSTKTQWAFVERGKIQYFSAGGINPSTQTVVKETFLNVQITENLRLSEVVYYYGAGIKTESNKTFIQNLLKESGCKGNIQVMSDLFGACRACCGNQEGLVGILGTGSNFCFFDGNNIHQKSPSLGYILGDEGSGFNIGKNVLRNYFYGEMPSDIKSLFENMYTPDLDTILENSYKRAGNNAYIASFAGFLTHTDQSYAQSVIRPLFKEYFDKKVHPFESQFNLPVYVTGSIAHHFRNILLEIFNENKLKIDNVIEKPLQNLIAFHTD